MEEIIIPVVEDTIVETPVVTEEVVVEEVKIVEETPVVVEEVVVVEETPEVQIVSDTHINQDGGSITNNVDPSQDRGVQQ